MRVLSGSGSWERVIALESEDENRLLKALMISRYNRAQLIRAIFSLLGGLTCCCLAFLFFRYAAAFVAWRFELPLSSAQTGWIGLAGLAVVLASGYRTWKSQGGLQGYHESSLYHDLGEETAGAVVVGIYAHRITAPAYMLTQLFLSGPLLLLRSLTLVSSRIPESPELSNRLQQALELLCAANKWQSLADHPSHRTEILYLAQMGLIDFSGHSNPPRIKAN